jgi:protein-disulfide isomerase
MKKQRFIGLFVLLNVALFGLAALAKSRHLDTFATAIDKTFLFPDFASMPIAAMVVAAEVLLCFGLIAPRARRQSMVFALGLSVIFLFYQLWRIHSKIDEDCGCFGDLFILSPKHSILLDALMIASQLLYLNFTANSTEDVSTRNLKAKSMVTVNACIAATTVAMSSVFLIGVIRNQAVLETVSDINIIPTHANLQRLIGDNVTDYPITLIEFGDYQCPPCRANHLVVGPLLEKYPGRIRLVFHDFPLLSLHPLAQRAAEVHQAAMRTGVGSLVHEEMMRTPLDDGLLTRLEQKFKVDRNQDAPRVQKDVELAKAMGVQQTPTFFLYTDQGRLILLSSAAQIEKYAQNAVERR